jgi:hypothetical protein
LPIVERRRTSRLDPRSAWLRDFRRDRHSQFGEDGIIEKIFRTIGEQSRWCVEFGAWDGVHLSNTRSLIADRGWSAVLIEGDPGRYETLRANCAGFAGAVHPVNAVVGWSGAAALDSILAGTPVPAGFDLLSIDIDGNDWHVWNAVAGYAPRVVIIEFNPTVPNDVLFVQDADPDVRQGSSLLAMIELGRRKGYELVAATEANAIFVERGSFGRFGIADNGIDAMYDCRHDLALFHGFDGTFYGAGEMVVNWFGIPIAQEDLQILPKAMRRYPG